MRTDISVTGDWNRDGLYAIGGSRNLMHTFIPKNGTATTVVNRGKGTYLPVTGK